jgi:hypothetical protein
MKTILCLLFSESRRILRAGDCESVGCSYVYDNCVCTIYDDNNNNTIIWNGRKWEIMKKNGTWSGGVMNSRGLGTTHMGENVIYIPITKCGEVYCPPTKNICCENHCC